MSKHTNSLETIDALIKSCDSAFWYWYNRFNLQCLNAQDDIKADITAQLLKHAQKWDTNPRRVSFANVMNRNIALWLLSCQHFYRGATGATSWVGYKAMRNSGEYRGANHPRHRLQYSVSLDADQMHNGESTDTSLKDILYDITDVPEYEHKLLQPNLLKEALTKDEIELVNLMYYKTVKCNTKTIWHNRKWRKRIIELAQKTELGPRSTKDFFQRNKLPFERLKYKLARTLSF